MNDGEKLGTIKGVSFVDSFIRRLFTLPLRCVIPHQITRLQ